MSAPPFFIALILVVVGFLILWVIIRSAVESAIIRAHRVTSKRPETEQGS